MLLTLIQPTVLNTCFTNGNTEIDTQSSKFSSFNFWLFVNFSRTIKHIFLFPVTLEIKLHLFNNGIFIHFSNKDLVKGINLYLLVAAQLGLKMDSVE